MSNSELDIQIRELQNQKLAILEAENTKRITEKNNRKTVYGIVDMDKKVIRKYQMFNDGARLLKETDKIAVDIQIPEMLESLISKKKLIKVFVGGRGGGKSVSGGYISSGLGKDFNMDMAFFRDKQNTIDDSLHKVIADGLPKLEIDSYTVEKTTIKNNKTSSKFIFRGLYGNPDGAKGIQGYKRFILDEAQSISQEAFDKLMPSMREEDGEIWIFGNPGSSEDPFSKEFILPYLDDLEKHGYYEDDTILVQKINYSDNPFHSSASEKLRLKDLKTKSTAEYQHIWEGKFNDSIPDALIEPEWFDAAIDLHKQEKFKDLFDSVDPFICAFDPSDKGGDNKAFARRQGSIIKDIKDKRDGDFGDGVKWSIKESRDGGCDHYVFDVAGMGVGVREIATKAFNTQKISIHEFNGKNSPDDKKKKYNPEDKEDKKTNGDVFSNRRSQYMYRLRLRFKNSFDLYVRNMYIDPSKCISIDSDGIGKDDRGQSLLQALRSEVSRQPMKNNADDKIQMMNKEEMKRKGIKSPNMLDALSMTMIEPKSKNQKIFKKLDYKKISMC
jgi:phage terminase large subunit